MAGVNPETGAVRVPVGADAERWSTMRGCKVVLGLARTVVSTVRLFDALEVFRADFRVQVIFAVDEGSAFRDGVHALLAEHGACVVPWHQLGTIRVDLVVAASENVDVGPITAPVVILPHGIGFHKFVPDSRSSRRRLAGVARPELLASGRLTTVVSHPSQVRQLVDAHPEMAGQTLVVGDPVYDRLVASRRMRAEYRRQLGVAAGQRLVVISSTWGDESLLGRWRGLPARLLAELPADEYRVAAIIHPNVWYGHSQWQVRTWLADAADAGLMVVPPTAGWQATLLAADRLVGDHGSVTLYGATLGIPTLLATFGGEAVPGTAITMLAQTTPRLDPDAGLCAQIDPTEADPQQARRLADAVFAMVGHAAEGLRRLCYELLELPAPTAPVPVRVWPPPTVEYRAATSFAVHSDLTAGRVSVRRYPAAVPAADVGSGHRHLAAYLCERDQRLIDNASVLVGTEITEPDQARTKAGQVLDRQPGCVLAAIATTTGCMAVTRDGRQLTIDGEADPMLLAAVGYTMLRAGRLDDADLLLRAGPVTDRVRVTRP